MMFESLGNAFVSQNVESRHFYSFPRQNSPLGSHHEPLDRTKLLTPSQAASFLKISSAQQKVGCGENHDARQISIALYGCLVAHRK